ncbi:MAG: exodeoxyribonuclease VII large subunit [Pseudomonadota bacterium]
MSSLIEDDGPFQDGPGNTPEFSVSELSGAVKRMVEGEFGHVRVRGEVGRVSRPRSGHIYLDMKDDRAVLAGVIWKGVAAGLATQPEEGMEVVATGRMTTFPGQSRYQIVIESLAPAGVGALMAMLEKRRKMLAAEGLFDETRKRMLPFLPRTIGVVTSPSGAVIRDILHRLSERFPVRVLVWPVAVQGERCAPEVTSAINGFSALPPDGPVPRPDVVIVARGGGSVEDLWGFNEEAVVRAAAASTVPLISAVGHETDTTLIDHAADRRAPTPTAAAEMAVPVRAELAAMLSDLQARRLRAVETALERRRQRLTDLSRTLPRPEQILAERRQRLDLAAARLPTTETLFADNRRRLDVATARLPTAQTLFADLRRRLQVASASLKRPDAVLSDVRQQLASLAGRLAPALMARTQTARLALSHPAGALRPEPLRRHLATLSDRIADQRKRLHSSGRRQPSQARDRLTALERTLQAFSYRATLARGYAVVRDAKGRLLPAAGGVNAGMALDIEFTDGRVAAVAGATTTDTETPDAPKPAQRKRKTAAKDDGQGSLF